MSGPFGSSQWMYASGGFYNNVVNQSLRFDDGDSAVLTRTPGSASNQRVWTWSGWVKRANITANSLIFGCGSDANNFAFIGFSSDDTIDIRNYQGGSYTYSFKTTQLFRDVSAWYHLVLAADMANSTAADRIKLYVNGARVTNFNSAPSPSTSDLLTNSDIQHVIGSGYYNDGSGLNAFLDGYLAEVNFVDGTALTPASFGETKSGVWIPKSPSVTYGTNGFRLQFKQTGTSQNASGIGADTSGATNHFAVANLVASDSNMPDCPENNFATLNPLRVNQQAQAFAEGNLKFTSSQSSTNPACVSTFAVSSGKWYWEVLVVTAANASNSVGIATIEGNLEADNLAGYQKDWAFSYQADGNKRNNNSAASYGASFTDGDIIAVMLDLDNGNLYFRKNNAIQASGAVAYASLSGTFTSYSIVYGGGAQIYNFGQEGSFAGAKTAQGNADGNGQGDFFYAPPSGYIALCAANLPDPAIDPAEDDTPADHFNTVLYTGNGSGRDITGVGFSPDWIWGKARNHGYSHWVYDSVRGAEKLIRPDTEAAEATQGQGVTAFLTDGFTQGTTDDHNENNKTFVAWNWLAGTAFSNDASATSVGTIDSAGQVNTKAGFSIIGYTGTGSNATFAHGLGKTPTMIIVTGRSINYGGGVGGDWIVWHNAIAATERIYLNYNLAKGTSAATWNSTAPNSTVVSLGDNLHINYDSSSTYIMYAFTDIEGYSKAGSYVGNNNANGPFVFTGFRPAWIMVKSLSGGTNYDWIIYDNARSPTNTVGAALEVDAIAEATGTNRGLPIDILSNGFKHRSSYSENNTNASYLYLAFAEQPFKYANAR